uniref:Lipoprotein n=1 Tax=Mycobacterium phage Pharb TaxID=3136626 RepID=A0AAU8GRH2_9VIRU
MNFKGLAAMAVVGVAVAGCSMSNQEWHNDCRVNGKDILTEVHGSNGDTHTTRTMRLSTSCGSFNVEDSLAAGFNSWDTWQALAVGKSYDIRTGGYRVGFLSQFPTVLEIRAK